MDIPYNLFPSGLEALLVALVILALLVVPFVFYLITLQNTFKALQPENRRMPPGQVWLLFIPFFNIVWQFIVVNRLADSIQRELRARGIEAAETTRGPGKAYCILNCCSVIPLAGTVARLVALICWIIHWVKTNEYRKQFIAEPFIVQADDSEIFGYGKY
ncbi:DUF4328 domain-containing protein [Taibaiella koreensis]|uniref:DUF4328 domain-containing protein n=1 Tax=Taibaiella koreensis TaxID=1268548 RepID=UPI0013C3177C|nr:DUF4328 domain-containing protein [Taibaiella koreensis]